MRSRSPRFLFPLSAAAGSLLLGGALLAAPQDDAPTAKQIAEAGQLFAASCAGCHLPPDPGHATDLAWLGQVTETA